MLLSWLIVKVHDRTVVAEVAPAVGLLAEVAGGALVWTAELLGAAVDCAIVDDIALIPNIERPSPRSSIGSSSMGSSS